MRCFVGTDERGKRKSGTGDTIDKITKINFKKCSLLASSGHFEFQKLLQKLNSHRATKY